jgi:hypothetical protein
MGSSSSTLQQLSLQEQIIAELRSSKAALESVIESKDAVIEAKDKLLAKQESLNQQPDAPASSSADTTAQRPAAAEACDRKQKRARQATQPLEKDEILDEIFCYVGWKEWLYVGAVCRRWRGRYLSMCYKARADEEEHAFQTSHKSSFVTVARFSMALDNGLKMPNEHKAGDFFDDLPVLSEQPIEVLTLARVHGAAWHDCLCRDAALFGDLKLLKWLHKSGCSWNVTQVADHAMRSRQDRPTTILPWLFSTVQLWSQTDKDKLLVVAGIENRISAAELLLANGAEWPSTFIGEQILSGGKAVRACWHDKAVAWALSKGCSWGEWRCQDLAPELYNDAYSRADAVKLLNWAHEHGCPCTCDAAVTEGEAVAA